MWQEVVKEMRSIYEYICICMRRRNDDSEGCPEYTGWSNPTITCTHCNRQFSGEDCCKAHLIQTKREETKMEKDLRYISHTLLTISLCSISIPFAASTCSRKSFYLVRVRRLAYLARVRHFTYLVRVRHFAYLVRVRRFTYLVRVRHFTPLEFRYHPVRVLSKAC